MTAADCFLKLRDNAVYHRAILQRRFQSDAENLLLWETRAQFPHHAVAQRRMVDAHKRQPEPFGQMEHPGKRGELDLVLG